MFAVSDLNLVELVGGPSNCLLFRLLIISESQKSRKVAVVEVALAKVLPDVFLHASLLSHLEVTGLSFNDFFDNVSIGKRKLPSSRITHQWAMPTDPANISLR